MDFFPGPLGFDKPVSIILVTVFSAFNGSSSYIHEKHKSIASTGSQQNFNFMALHLQNFKGVIFNQLKL
jgi:hypothetical protein